MPGAFKGYFYTEAFLRRSGLPRQDVLDIEGVARTAHEAGIPLIVDKSPSSTPVSAPPRAPKVWNSRP
jgi:O-acetylhomoserine/O-acetylserine sulfhydrylase-like pyridoxal-dependent enzyme